MLAALEPIVHNHRLVIDPSIAENRRFQYQFTRLTGERGCLEYEDELEALANCVALFTDDLRYDQEHLRENYKKKAMDEALKEHYALCGIKKQGPRWFVHN